MFLPKGKEKLKKKRKAKEQEEKQEEKMNESTGSTPIMKRTRRSYTTSDMNQSISPSSSSPQSLVTEHLKETTRENVRKKFNNILRNSSVSSDIEEAVYTSPYKDEKEYKEKARELLFNLKTYEYLRDNVLSGKIDAKKFTSLSAKDLQFENISEEKKAALQKKVNAEYMDRIPWSDACTDSYVLKKTGCFIGGNHEDDGSF